MFAGAPGAVLTAIDRRGAVTRGNRRAPGLVLVSCAFGVAAEERTGGDVRQSIQSFEQAEPATGACTGCRPRGREPAPGSAGLWYVWGLGSTYTRLKFP
jgi:hypothetical protein